MTKKTLAELRAEKNLTQRALAKELNIANSSIAMYETGERVPTLKIAIEIANYFDIPIESIYFPKLDL
ncbi:MAG: helix-turn-helix transcriptional regulator [Intestinibacter sp.]|uniref:helix-turn-helix transcriptional regulator n=1 Tax=Intestinibacter sp. TaxID=1965304 RepID=UPI003F13B025